MICRTQILPVATAIFFACAASFADSDAEKKPISRAADVELALEKIAPFDYYAPSPRADEGFAELKKLADAGSPEAAAALGDIYAKRSYGTKFAKFKNPELAEKYSVLAASLGDSDTAEELFDNIAKYPDRQYALAKKIPPANADKKTARFLLDSFRGAISPAQARCFCFDLWEAPDFGEQPLVVDALKYFETARILAQKYPDSDFCTPLADCYENGIGVKKSHAKAVAEIEKIALSKSRPDAVFAFLWLARDALKKGDSDSAEILFNEALCDVSHDSAFPILNAARRFYAGICCAPDREFAKKILLLAAKRADLYALRNELFAPLSAMLSGKFDPRDADISELCLVCDDAKESERILSEELLKLRGLPVDRIPTAAELEVFFGGKIDRDSKASSAFEIADAYRAVFGGKALAPLFENFNKLRDDRSVPSKRRMSQSYRGEGDILYYFGGDDSETDVPRVFGFKETAPSSVSQSR